MIVSLALAQDIDLNVLTLNSVSISGYVTSPGTYKVTRVDRITDLLNQAMMPRQLELYRSPVAPPEIDILKKTHPIPEYREDTATEEEEALQGLRHVKLIRNGVAQEYDIFSFLRRGDLSQNPILRDGDHVHIPYATEVVEVIGAVGMPGKLEYRAGDTLGDVIELAVGTIPGADLSRVRLSEYQPTDKGYQSQTLDLNANPELRQREIHPRDIVMVPLTKLSNHRRVKISGEVLYQGEFIVSEDTGIWDLIQMAGGLTEEADLDNAVVLNATINADPDPEFERLRESPLTNLSPIEYSYLRNKVRQAKGRYSVDFARIIQSEGLEGDIILQDSDVIWIPQKVNMIWVSGHVRNPGLVPHKQGESWSYYIQQAGGYANNYNRQGIRLMRSHSGNWVKVRDNMEVNPGDMIFVADKLDRSFWTDVRDIIGVTASAITILIGVENLIK
nr:hypothetical protein [Candidatus Cloacimonadota bacterium]